MLESSLTLTGVCLVQGLAVTTITLLRLNDPSADRSFVISTTEYLLASVYVLSWAKVTETSTEATRNFSICPSRTLRYHVCLVHI